ncbi:MAG TPA: hypothetical protein VIJ29_01720 [Candidatus Paceibacterota bacterium]
MAEPKKFKFKVARRIYDRNYYKAQAMLHDPWFVEKANWLTKRFAEVGCPLPKRPFKMYKDYLAWNDRYWKRHEEMEKSEKFLEAKQRITGGKAIMSAEEFYALEDFRKVFLPPIYGQIFKEILEHFKINREDKGFNHFLEFYFFFGQKYYYTSPFSVISKRNEETNEMELFLHIHGYTKKEDIVRHWNWVAADQKYLKDFVGKNKAWKTFDRDIEIYGVYKQLNALMGTR